MSNPAFTWWRAPGLLSRLLADAVRGQFLSDHPGLDVPVPPWPDSFDFVDDLGADSLDRLALATAVSVHLQINRSGLDDALLARRRLGDWRDVAAQALTLYSDSFHVRSSGSQGAPRWHAHRLNVLVAEVEAVLALLPPGRGRIVSLVPAHHIYGFLFTILLPARLGCSVWEARAASPVSVAGRLMPGDVIVAHPHWWRLLAESGVPLPPAVGLTATAPCPPAVAQALRGAGLAELIEIYGASETAGIGWRPAGTGPFQLLPAWQPGEDGQLVAADGRRVDLPDHLAWQENGRFEVLGRKDGQVQVGGVNVDLAEVRRTILAVAGVRDVALRLAASGRLKAFIASDVLPGDLRPALQAAVSATLPPPARPASWTFGPALPLTPAGKPSDWQEGA